MERDEIVMLVAANIQAAMKDRGINRAELARLAGLNATGVYDIISGKSRSPRLDTINKIAAALGVPLASLLEEKPVKELRNQIMAAVQSLPESECERLLLIAQSLRKPLGG